MSTDQSKPDSPLPVSPDQVIAPALDVVKARLGEMATRPARFDTPATGRTITHPASGVNEGHQLKQATGGDQWYVGHPSQY